MKAVLRVDGRWMAVARIAPGPKGRVAKYARTEAEAVAAAEALERETKEQALAFVKAQAEARTLNPLTSYPQGSFGEFLYRTWVPHVYPGLRKTSRRRYDSQVVYHLLPGLATTKIAEIGYVEAQQFQLQLKAVDGKPMSDRQRREIVLRFREIMGLYAAIASGRGEAARTDWKLTTVPKPPKKKKRIEPEEDFTVRIMNAARGSYMVGPLFAALFLGLRRGEICGLRWSHIDQKNLVMSVREQHQPEYGDELVETKGEERVIPITEALYTRLRAVGNRNSPYVFTNGKGKRLAPNEISKKPPLLCKKAGLRKATLHDLRSYAGSNLAALGVDPFTIMEILGHKEMSTTLIYVNQKSKLKRDAISKLLDSVSFDSEPVDTSLDDNNLKAS